MIADCFTRATCDNSSIGATFKREHESNRLSLARVTIPSYHIPESCAIFRALSRSCFGYTPARYGTIQCPRCTPYIKYLGISVNAVARQERRDYIDQI